MKLSELGLAYPRHRVIQFSASVSLDGDPLVLLKQQNADRNSAPSLSCKNFWSNPRPFSPA